MFESSRERVAEKFNDLFGPHLKPVQQKWSALPERDRFALSALGMMLLIAGVYFLMWQPLKSWSDQAQLQYESKSSLVRWIEQNRADLLSAKKSGQRSSGAGGRSILSIVNQEARRHKLTIKRVEPKGDNQLRVWVDNIKFNSLLAWLNTLADRYSIEVESISLDKGDESGRVNSMLTLVK